VYVYDFSNDEKERRIYYGIMLACNEYSSEAGPTTTIQSGETVVPLPKDTQIHSRSSEVCPSPATPLE